MSFKLKLAYKAIYKYSSKIFRQLKQIIFYGLEFASGQKKPLAMTDE